jgi:hypothetical protein
MRLLTTILIAIAVGIELGVFALAVRTTAMLFAASSKNREAILLAILSKNKHLSGSRIRLSFYVNRAVIYWSIFFAPFIYKAIHTWIWI